MNTDIHLVIVALAAAIGGILAAYLGYLDSGEPFNKRKFGKSVVAAVLASVGFAIGYSFADGIGVKDVFLAILAGAGWDSITNRVLGAFAVRKPGG